MAEQMTGLFGPSPYEIQQARSQTLSNDAADFAKMNATQRGVMGLYQGGAGLARMGAGMMGMVDPAVEQAQSTSDIQKGIDHTTSEGLLKGAAALQNVNPKLAIQYAQAAQAMKEKEAETAYKTEQTAKMKRDPMFRPYESEKMLAILRDPKSTADEKKYAAEFLKNNASSGGNTGTGQLVPGADGFMYRVDKGTGESSIVKDANGGPLSVAQYDAALAEKLSRAKEGGKETGKIAAGAMQQLPRVEMDLRSIQDLGAKLFAHPGYQQLVGAGVFGLKDLAGSSVPGADALYKQLTGLGYLMAREDLRGQGQVTENEANAALAAYNRMNTKLSEKDFREAYNDFVQRVQNVRDILRSKAGATFNQAPFQQATTPTPVTPTQKPFKETITSVEQAFALYKRGVLTRDTANKIIHEIKKNGVQK